MFSIRMMIPIFDYSYSISDIHSVFNIESDSPTIRFSVVSLDPKPNIAGENKHSVLIQE